GFSKIGDVMAGLKGLGKVEVPNINVDGAIALPDGAKMLPDGTINLPSGTAVPDGAVKLPDGNIKLPEGTTTFPPGTVKLPEAGPSRFMDLEGNIYKADGSLDQSGKAAKQEPSPDTGADTPRADAPKPDTPIKVEVPDRVPAGVGGRGDDFTRVGSNISDPVRAADDLPGTRPDTTPGGHVPDNMPRNSTDTHGPSAPGPRSDTPTTGGGHTDRPSTAGGGPETPSTGGGRPEAPGGAGHTDGPSTNGGNPETPGGTGPGASAGDGPETPGGGGGTGDGPGNGPGMPEQQPAVILEGPRIGQQPSGPMAPGREAAVTEALKNAKVPPVDQGRMLVQLRKSEYGAAVAEYIASGRFADTPGFKNPEGLLFQVKQNGMIPAVHQALEYAADLQSKGIKNIEFELKLPAQKLDLDVLVRTPDGRIEFGAQLKDVDSVAGIKSAVKKIAEKQLGGPGVDVKHALLDIRGLRGELTEREIQAVQRAADRSNASFELRFDDGSVTIFPTNATKP
ncbi:hypothetical protein ACWDYJ_07395, partial [Streptomyces sp. NPDC003042]